jgi:hypothetical protein
MANIIVTKQRGKSAKATVTFDRVRPPAPKPKSAPTVISVPVNSGQNFASGGVQRNLDETSFRKYLDGFVEIQPKDLPRTPGGRLRYAIDTVDGNGAIVSSLYRLGGWISGVRPDLSAVTLFNPYAKKSWNVQVRQRPGKRLRMYYQSHGTSDEISTIRSLLTKIENGQLKFA